MNTEKSMMVVEEVARELRVGKSKVYEMINKGELPVIRIGRKFRIPVVLFRQWLEKNA